MERIVEEEVPNRAVAWDSRVFYDFDCDYISDDDDLEDENIDLQYRINIADLFYPRLNEENSFRASAIFDAIYALRRPVSMTKAIYGRSMKSKAIKVSVSSDCDEVVTKILGLFENDDLKIDEVILKACGQALENLQYIATEVMNTSEELYQYNCQPSQHHIPDKPDIVIVCLEVRLSKHKPKNILFRKQPRLNYIINAVEYLIKDIKSVKCKFHAKKFRGPSKRKHKQIKAVEGFNKTCPICIEEFDDNDIKKIKVPEEQKSGVKAINSYDPKHQEQYDKIAKLKNKFFKKFEKFYTDLQSQKPKEDHDSELAGEGLCFIVGCKHVFHKTCLKEWIKSKKICPICRGKIS